MEEERTKVTPDESSKTQKTEEENSRRLPNSLPLNGLA
jgi:hypothetical protein